MAPPAFLTTNSDIASIAGSMAIIFGLYRLNRGIKRQKDLMEAPGDFQDEIIGDFMKSCGPISRLCATCAVGNAAFLVKMGGSVLSVAALTAAIALVWKVEMSMRGLWMKLRGLKKAKEAGVAMI